MKLIFLSTFVLTGAALFGSTISTVTDSTGTANTVAITSYTATGATMGDFSITANFAGGGSAQCDWSPSISFTGSGTGEAGCDATSGSNSFGITFKAANATYPDQTAGTNWTLFDLGSANITSVILNGLGGGGNAGATGDGHYVEFDLCDSGGTISLTNSGGCNTEGTLGSNIGYDASNGTGGSSITASAAYTNILNLASHTAVGDIYGELTLSFATTGSHQFVSGDTFTFQADTDLLSGCSTCGSSVPEPATMGLAGFALAGLGLLRRRKRTSQL